MTARLFAFCAMLLALCYGGQVYAAPTHLQPQLIAESADPAPGRTVMLALAMKTEAGWHGYWKNPGDAGVGTQFRWSLPNGVTVGEVRYPVPEKLLVSGLMNHVYQGDHALLIPLALSGAVAKGDLLPLKVELDWLACTDRICVPEHGSLSLILKAGGGAEDPEVREKFDLWRTKLPKPLGGKAQFVRDGDKLRIAIPLPEALAAPDPWFFTETEDAVAYSKPQRIERVGDMLVVEAEASGQSTPDSLTGILAYGKGQGLVISALPGVVPTAPSSGGWGQILAALGGALLGGFLLNIMPCVFPIISLKALSLARGGGDEGAARREAIAYTVGVVATCTALGGLLLGLRASGVAVGWAFQLQNPYIIALLLALAVAITLNLAGLFHLPVLGGGDALAGKGGMSGSFWTGALAAFVATPCTGPFMAAALGAALVLPTIAALAIFAGLGLGLAAPFLAIAYIPALRNRLPRPGSWMVRFQRFLAIPMALTALALGWLLWRQVAPSAASQTAGIERAIPFNESRLNAMRAAGKPVFLIFTADWCLTCKVNEKAAIERDEVQQSFAKKGITQMVGDWTNNDAAITRFLESQQRSGVPLYLFYPAGGGAPRVMPQVLTVDMMLGL
jgi:DsbC/DsbD-like thiol-disulfide interchange protein/cytochrome c biogenesis protein CcdA